MCAVQVEVVSSYLVSNTIEDVCHVAEMARGEDWVQKLALPAMLGATSRQNSGAEKQGEGAVCEHGYISYEENHTSLSTRERYTLTARDLSGETLDP